MAIDNHLNEINKTYFQHLVGAWRVAFILLVHGLLPNVWKDRASEEICTQKRY
jgi:hypothetical protein